MTYRIPFSTRSNNAELSSVRRVLFPSENNTKDQGEDSIFNYIDSKNKFYSFSKDATVTLTSVLSEDEGYSCTPSPDYQNFKNPASKADSKVSELLLQMNISTSCFEELSPGSIMAGHFSPGFTDLEVSMRSEGILDQALVDSCVLDDSDYSLDNTLLSGDHQELLTPLH